MSDARRDVRRRLAAGTLAGLFALAGCSLGGGEADKSGGEDGRSGGDRSGGGASLPGTEQSQWVLSKAPFRVDLLGLAKTSGKAVTARLRVTNVGGEQELFGQSDVGGRSNPQFRSLSGVTLVDGVNRRRYYPWWGRDGKCVCSMGRDHSMFIDAGASVEYVVNFPVPPVRKVMLMVPNTPPFLDVPIADRPGPVQPPPGEEERDPARIPLNSPEIVPLTDESEAVDGSSERTEDDKWVEVRLSADVLFALNKADLSPRAQSVLRDVAARINASKATAVTIDGYTDNSGNDAINIPLSRRRAQAVQRALAPMITKAGATFKSAGHGSADPVADNDSEKDRRRNRRVTVSFAR